MKHNDLAQRLKDQGLALFNSQELQRLTNLSRNAIRLWLMRRIRDGTILPLKKRRGVYCLAAAPPHEWLIANRLYAPSYISLESALSFYGILPEAVYAVTSITTKTTRTFESLGKTFTYQKIKRPAFGDYHPLSLEGQVALVAEREKALADYLYFVYRRQKTLNSRLNLSSINKRKLKQCVHQFKKPSFATWSLNVIA